MFGKAPERIRQWALLGMLLKDLRPVDALGFMDSAFGRSAVDWALIRTRVAAGGSLPEAAEGQPPEVLDALRQGEKDGRLPEALSALLVESDSPLVDAVDDGVVALVDRLLLAAMERRLPVLVLHPDGRVDPLDKVPAASVGAMTRRIWSMAGQPYWAPKPGTFQIRYPGKGAFEFRVRAAPDGALHIELAART